jgi:hypothetical protein
MGKLIEHIGLLDQLIEKLSEHTSVYQPYFIEHAIKQTKTLHVTVIWDAWKRLSADARSRLVLDAYERTGKFPVLKITVALGLTPVDAKNLGLLPFSVVPVVRKTDPIKPRELMAAIRELPIGFRFESADRVQVKFPNQDEANEAFEFLSEKVGGNAYWALTQEVASVE